MQKFMTFHLLLCSALLLSVIWPSHFAGLSGRDPTVHAYNSKEVRTQRTSSDLPILASGGIALGFGNVQEHGSMFASL